MSKLIPNFDELMMGEFSSDEEAFEAFFGGLVDELPDEQRERAFTLGEQFAKHLRATEANEFAYEIIDRMERVVPKAFPMLNALQVIQNVEVERRVRLTK
jgi:hypothetical protein